MPRPKGSKNKVTMIAAASIDYAALIDEKQSAKDSLNAEVTSIAANIDSLKADLKSKKAGRCRKGSRRSCKEGAGKWNYC